MEPQGVPNAPEAPLGAPDSYFFDIPPSQPLPKGVPAPEVLVSPDHTCAYAANCKRTLHYVVNDMLLAKRDHILHHIGRLRAMTLEVAHTKGVVEREVKSEASELLARLNASESLKQMRIQREVDELARHAGRLSSVSLRKSIRRRARRMPSRRSFLDDTGCARRATRLPSFFSTHLHFSASYRQLPESLKIHLP